ncbi:MAG: sugar transferase [Candidatus Nealsonbacteria bacterium]
MLNALNLRKFLLFSGDIICLYLSLLGTIFLGFWGDFNWHWISLHLIPFSILYFFWLVVFYVFGLYDLKTVKAGPFLYTKIFGAILACLGIGIAFFYLIPLFGITPKTNLVLNIFILSVLFFSWRKIFSLLFSSRFLNRVIIIGEDHRVKELSKEIELRPYLGYKLIFIEQNQDLLSQVQEKKIDTIIVPSDINDNPSLVENLYRCLPTKVNFLDWTKAYEMVCNKVPVSFITQIWFLKNLQEGEKAFYDKIKRVMDILLASITLVITFFLWPIVAVLIKFGDMGPVIYRQKRIGKDGKLFFLFKFRSMNVGAENKTGPVWADKEDPRTTKIGCLLRKIHLDELPQMINVLRGDISLVGPRPERPEFVENLEKEIPHYHVRHLIKPGFTGWAQIKFRYGRSIMDSQEKFQYDLYYLKNRSLLLDLGILLKTIQLFFKKE